MTVELAKEAVQPLWRTKLDYWLNPKVLKKVDELPEHANDDVDPDPPSGAPAARLWPRVFPGL